MRPSACAINAACRAGEASATPDEDDAAVRSQPVAEGEAQVLEIAAGAMHKHDRELVGRRRGAKLQHMQLAALDLDEAP